MKTWVQALIEDARALTSEGRRACERLGEPVPAFLQGDPSPRTLELWAEARAIGGAYRFHQWAASKLQSSVRKNYGERLVLGAHHFLKDGFRYLSLVHNLSNPRPEPSMSLECPTCDCSKDDDGKRADCLIDRFRRAYTYIDAVDIEEWYSRQTGIAATDVRAFFCFAAPSNLQIRTAFTSILARELYPMTVQIQPKQTNESEALRDAFLCTAIQAAHEWTGIPIRGTGGCRFRAATKFEMKADAVRKVWRKFEKIHESSRI